ncbi:hypothetical protein J8J14_16920 [Roseomonas sp. SSH11]|uniref:Uncharacterized protein n=1 Tax=Pararoseomonas baculiformis TaxID=2820812 RepID=A0ABS4AHF9_9PROT|nr:hypothetical protein [Pararoseomonas baculiformis]MBP0446460.1 hypothetical protein [Pararoseomonas baculiformis]
MIPPLTRPALALAALAGALAAAPRPAEAAPGPGALPSQAAQALQPVQYYYCPPGYHFSRRWGGCRPNRPPEYYAPPPTYYAPPPAYYAPPPPRYYVPPPPPPGPRYYYRY